jgi:hypothetical protein
MQRDVAVAIRNRSVEQRDVGRERREHADLAERGHDPRVGVVLLHRRAGDGTCGHRRQAARRGFEPLREGEE